MRFVSPRVHGVLDYLFAALFLLAPFMLEFRSDAAKLAAFAFGGALLSMSVLTRYPLGVLRLIPFQVHGYAELVGAAVLLILPWAAGFAGFGATRNFFLGTGIVLFGLWATTDYKAAEAGKRGVIGRQIRSGA